MESLRFVLPQSEIPTHWYNIAADLPTPAPPHLHPGTQQPLQPAFPASFPTAELPLRRRGGHR